MWSESRCRHIPAYVTEYKPFLLCVNRHVASTYCHGLLILQRKQVYSHLKIGKRSYLLWVFYMLCSTLKSTVCLTVYALTQTLKIPDVIRGLSCPLASDHTGFKDHVHQPPSMSWPWPQHSSQEKTRCPHPYATFFSCTLCCFHPSNPLPSWFTLHFTADIISQISAYLAKILTGFDGMRGENQPLLFQCSILSNISWLIRTTHYHDVIKHY